MTSRELRFAGAGDSPIRPASEYGRLLAAARALGTSLTDFIHDATMQAVSEVEAGDNERRLAAALARSRFGHPQPIRCSCDRLSRLPPAVSAMSHDPECRYRRSYEEWRASVA